MKSKLSEKILKITRPTLSERIRDLEKSIQSLNENEIPVLHREFLILLIERNPDNRRLVSLLNKVNGVIRTRKNLFN